jgi:hypothetical protein
MRREVMVSELNETLIETYRYCKNINYSGWDPYDGLNSKVFQRSFFKKSAIARIFWTQLFKHSPINFRQIMMVKEGQNPKGLALVLSSLCNILGTSIAPPGSQIDREIRVEIINISDQLLQLRSQNYKHFCWGYNFPWQSRASYLPKWTPTIVCTAFVVDGLLSAYKVTLDKRYLDACISSTLFATNDLNKIETKSGVGFSYSPLDNRFVYNATLLGSRFLSAVSEVTQEKSLLTVAKSSIESTREAFSYDGSFVYARESISKWQDNFHTGFNLESLARYRTISGDTDYDKVIQLGTDYWLKNFFLKNGTCKYYNNKVYPLDIHCSSQVFPTLYYLGLSNKQILLQEKVYLQMIKTFYVSSGNFRFQVKKQFPIKIKYFRWGTAWAFYGMSYFLKARETKFNHLL